MWKIARVPGLTFEGTGSVLGNRNLSEGEVDLDYIRTVLLPE